jgi:sortase A
VRILELIRRSADDPLLKIGAGAMILALGFAVVVAVFAFLDEPERAVAAKSSEGAKVEPLVRSDPGIDPWVEKDIPPPRPEPEPAPTLEPTVDPQPVSVAEPESRPEPAPRPEPVPRPDPPPEPRQQTRALEVEETDFPLPTDRQVEAANRPRHYDLPSGAIMGLTIEAIGLHDVPVLNSDSSTALDRGVIHLPDTSLPWSETPERNVYLAGHRLGWPGTGSHLVFYRLGALRNGDEVTLRDRDGRRYNYRVIDSFLVNPDDTWVTGRVRGRDLLTLQTCTPIPTFEKRLIIRAERI